MAEENQPKVRIARFEDIFNFEGGYSIRIPDYQPPYVWNAEKVETRINDLQYHIEHNSGQAYYMGSILFFCQNGDYEIIDGQQRLTSLLILDKIANNRKCIIAKHTPESVLRTRHVRHKPMI